MIRKQPVAVNFAAGLETKTDPWQIPIGNFLTLNNSIFVKGGRLTKRNGYQPIITVNSTTSHVGSFTAGSPAMNKFITTLNGNITTVGSQSINALNPANDTLVEKGSITPLNLTTLPLIRNSYNQTIVDAVVASNGLVLTVYTETNNGVSTNKYAIADSVSGQNIVSPTTIPISSGTVSGGMRVFLMANYFVVVFTNTISAVAHLQYVAISIANPTIVTTNQDIAASYIASTGLSWDGVVFNNTLYIAYNTTSGGQSVKITYLTQSAAAQGQTPVAPHTFAGRTATLMTVTADSTPQIYLTFYDSVSQTGYTAIVDLFLNVVLAPVHDITSSTIANIASAAQNGVTTIYYEDNNSYSYDSGIPSNRVTKFSVTSSGTIGALATVVLSVGLASKVFIMNGKQYFLAAYESAYQGTYFLIDGTDSTIFSPIVVAKLAYENSPGYLSVLPSVTVVGQNAYVGYLIKDLVAAEATAPAAPVAGVIPGVYTQTGINLATFNFNPQIVSVEMAGNLNITGGFLWNYDGYLPVENNFFLYPDNVEVSGSGTAGSMSAQKYFYQVCYEWTDNQGNVYRSIPSIAVTVTLTSDTSVLVNVPYLRLTYKVQNPAKIVIYRWSTAQPVFYRVTSLTNVQTNLTYTDSLAYTDTLADASILGNDILYTTGGVLEDVNGNAFDAVAPFDDRLFGIESENKNLLEYSKQVLDGTPVEISDLLTYYVAPSIGAQGPTGPMRCASAMDDKLIIFKNTAMNYINGNGPDNTGANSSYSGSPIFITSTVGCVNQASIIFQPQGLMFEFQSKAGNQIWLLGRDLSTNYIGSPVEALTQNATVTSAVNVPGTNQVRFSLSSGVTLIYDYFYRQWGSFTNVNAISSCIYQGVQAYLDSNGNIFQETPGQYTDNSNPILMNFTTGWINLAQLQGYQRAFFFYILGQYYSPFKMYVTVAYDFNPSPLHSVVITPTNFSPPYGGSGSDSETPYGQQSPCGGEDAVFNWRVFFKKQRCQSFQLTFQEIFDPSHATAPGQGFALSGLNLILGVKQGFRTISTRHSAGLR